MKRVGLAVITLLAALGCTAATAQTSPTIQAQNPPAVVRVVATITGVSVRGDHRSHYYLLWNRNVRTRPIGHAAMSCFHIFRSGDLTTASSFAQCVVTISLPLGKLSANGLIHTYARWTLIIVGGTNRYVAAAGPLFARRLSPGTYSWTFKIP